MVLFLLVFFLVIFIPLAEGVLLALLLREVHARHPLPLVESGYNNAWLRPKPKSNTANLAKALTTPDEPDAGAAPDNEEIQEDQETPFAEELTEEENRSFHSGTSVFDGSGIIPKNLPVSDALNLMMAESSAIVPNDLESRIEASTRLNDSLLQNVQHIRDDLDLDDLEDLAAALPKAKIDFTQELETDPEASSEPISPMAKELLGENFDFDALEQQTQQTPEVVMLDVQADETGVVQVSSPFLFADSPQLADFAAPQMILPTFSGDWIQESDSMTEPIEADASIFCFTEELQPMFVRKKRAN